MGYLTSVIPRMGFFMVGFVLGAVFALLLHNSILYMIIMDPPELTLLLEICILGLFFGMMSCCLWRKVIILGTSFLGSYVIFKGLSFIVGGYPSEFDINRLILY